MLFLVKISEKFSFFAVKKKSEGSLRQNADCDLSLAHELMMVRIKTMLLLMMIIMMVMMVTMMMIIKEQRGERSLRQTVFLPRLMRWSKKEKRRRRQGTSCQLT